MMKLEPYPYFSHEDIESDDEQRANLEQLANYLYLLPSDYDEFGMDNYMMNRENGRVVAIGEDHPTCGSVACAIGHGPKAGIEIRPLDFAWYSYAKRAFGFDEDEGSFVFGCQWSSVDNTARGAALRIYYALQNGFPAACNRNYSHQDDLQAINNWIYDQV